MKDVLLAPPIAFLVYIAFVSGLSLFGRFLAGPVTESSDAKSSTYAGGEIASVRPAVPGYKPFFVVALFFAILHLGVLVLGSSDLSA
ncbi:MAG: hypothetical protein JW966_04580, partial [Anaerolineae bacterium]|nr:hypothetical protein [Anaerolineae bacterium]